MVACKTAEQKMEFAQCRTRRRRRLAAAVLSAVLLTSVACVYVVRGQRSVVRRQRAVVHDDAPPRQRKSNLDGSLPVVLWHGMGDSCCAPYSIGKVASYISDELGEGAAPNNLTHSCACARRCRLLVST